MIASCAVFFASSSCFSSLSIASSSSFTSSAFGHVIFCRPVNSYFAGEFIHLVLLAEPLDERDQIAREGVGVVADAEVQFFEVRELFLLHGLAVVALRAWLGGLSFFAASRNAVCAAFCTAFVS